MRRFPDDETQAEKVSIIVKVLCTVHADNFFVVLKNLVCCKSSENTWNNLWNFSAILVLEIKLAYPASNSCSSNLFDFGSDFDVLEVICIHTFAQENWWIAPIRHNHLNATDISANSFLPFESNSLDWFVLWHSLQICDTWVSEIDWMFCFSKEREFSKSLETVFTWSAKQCWRLDLYNLHWFEVLQQLINFFFFQLEHLILLDFSSLYFFLKLSRDLVAIKFKQITVEFCPFQEDWHFGEFYLFFSCKFSEHYFELVKDWIQNHDLLADLLF